MDTRKGVAAAVMLGTLLLTMGACGSDSCACQYPDEDKSKGTSDNGKSKPA